MNSFFQPQMIQNIMPAPIKNMMRVLQQVREIKQNPSELATVLQRQGMITPEQAKEIQTMGSNYERVGQYLIQNGKMPSNVSTYEGQVNQLQNMLK